MCTSIIKSKANAELGRSESSPFANKKYGLCVIYGATINYRFYFFFFHLNRYFMFLFLFSPAQHTAEDSRQSDERYRLGRRWIMRVCIWSWNLSSDNLIFVRPRQWYLVTFKYLHFFHVLANRQHEGEKNEARRQKKSVLWHYRKLCLVCDILHASFIYWRREMLSERVYGKKEISNCW